MEGSRKLATRLDNGQHLPREGKEGDVQQLMWEGGMEG